MSSRVEGGVPLPAAMCVECGKLAVEVTPSSSCGKCMGVLVAEASSVDARFVAAAWGLVAGGWPRRRDVQRETVVVVGEEDLAGWVLPSLAIALRLAGGVPFAGVVVHPWPGEADPFVEGQDPRVVRLALAAGTGDVEAAEAALGAARTDSIDVDVDLDAAVVAGVAALDDGAPARAATLLASLLSAGVPPERVPALVRPILGAA